MAIAVLGEDVVGTSGSNQGGGCAQGTSGVAVAVLSVVRVGIGPSEAADRLKLYQPMPLEIVRFRMFPRVCRSDSMVSAS